MITDGRTLAGMTRQGFIVWHDERERHWTGWTVKRRHVQPGPKLENWYDTFRADPARCGGFAPCSLGKRDHAAIDAYELMARQFLAEVDREVEAVDKLALAVA